jgi:hypothetical protein
VSQYCRHAQPRPTGIPSPIKLVLMRRGTNRVWVLACAVTLTVLLAVAYHPQFGRNSATGMSAPSAPRTSIESGPLQNLLRSHFEGTGPARVTAGFHVRNLRESPRRLRRSCLLVAELRSAPAPSAAQPFVGQSQNRDTWSACLVRGSGIFVFTTLRGFPWNFSAIHTSIFSGGNGGSSWRQCYSSSSVIPV